MRAALLLERLVFPASARRNPVSCREGGHQGHKPAAHRPSSPLPLPDSCAQGSGCPREGAGKEGRPESEREAELQGEIQEVAEKAVAVSSEAA
jgi:hypothetical protein